MKNIPFFLRHGKAAVISMLLPLTFPPSAASQLATVLDARAEALAGCSVPLTNWGAGRMLSELTVSFVAAPAPFGLSELRTIAASARLPIAGGVVGLSLERQGSDLYKRQDAAAGIILKTSDGMLLGCGLVWRHESYARYGGAWSISLDAGLMAAVLEGCDVVASCTSVGTIAGDPEVSPVRSMRVGASCHLSPRIRVVAEAEKDLRFPLRLGTGVEYRALDVVVLRGGIGEEPARSAFGCSVSLGPVDVLYSADVHADLGWTHTVGVELVWGRE